MYVDLDIGLVVIILMNLCRTTMEETSEEYKIWGNFNVIIDLITFKAKYDQVKFKHLRLFVSIKIL